MFHTILLLSFAFDFSFIVLLGFCTCQEENNLTTEGTEFTKYFSDFSGFRGSYFLKFFLQIERIPGDLEPFSAKIIFLFNR